MDFIECSKAFLLVVEHKSFTTAAEQLGVSPSNVSKKVKHLESRVNASLINRTTRDLTITEPGEILANKLVLLTTGLETTLKEIKTYNSTPKGTLNIAANPLLGAKVISPVVPSFIEKYKDIAINLDVVPIGGRPELNHDITITTNNYELDTFSFKRVVLADYEIGFFASPNYLAKFDKIVSPEQLEQHNFILPEVYSRKKVFKLSNGYPVRLLRAPFISDNTEVLFDLAVRGTGLFFAPDMFVKNMVKKKKLVRVLPEYAGPKSQLIALLPTQEYALPKTQLFVRHLKSYLKQYTTLTETA